MKEKANKEAVLVFSVGAYEIQFGLNTVVRLVVSALPARLSVSDATSTALRNPEFWVQSLHLIAPEGYFLVKFSGVSFLPFKLFASTCVPRKKYSKTIYL